MYHLINKYKFGIKNKIYFFSGKDEAHKNQKGLLRWKSFDDMNWPELAFPSQVIRSTPRHLMAQGLLAGAEETFVDKRTN